MTRKRLTSKLRRRKRRRDRQAEQFDKTGDRGHAKAAKKEAKAVRYLKHLLRLVNRRNQEGLDWAWGEISGAGMRQAGKRFACRYLSHDASKNLDPAEAHRLASEGVTVLVVWETTADRAKAGRGAGRDDARDAQHQAQACGMPKGRPIFFAVDFEAQGPEVAEYFKGAAEVIGGDRVGAYAGLDCISYLFDHRLIRWGWQTYAWSRGLWDRRARLRQYSNGHVFEGVGVDYNRSVHPDFGQWKPS